MPRRRKSSDRHGLEHEIFQSQMACSRAPVMAALVPSTAAEPPPNLTGRSPHRQSSCKTQAWRGRSGPIRPGRGPRRAALQHRACPPPCRESQLSTRAWSVTVYLQNRETGRRSSPPHLPHFRSSRRAQKPWHRPPQGASHRSRFLTTQMATVTSRGAQYLPDHQPSTRKRWDTKRRLRRQLGPRVAEWHCLRFPHRLPHHDNL